SLEPRDNTNTTLANPIERLFVAPNFVNYHCEHHHFAAVPPYNLPRLHRLLRERGYFDRHDCLTRGYRNVIRRAVRADAVPAAA
ncbi:MAG: fatty acid desaturase, partial [Parasphingopyxis sp.]|uniref:fatty acid desaturase n=1 Tax=Parasphingopyxis sp. TaxID=1920299 RepID=UPI003F9EDC56